MFRLPFQGRRAPDARRPFYQDARHHRRRSWRAGRLAIAASVLVTAAVALAMLAGCDAASDTPSPGPAPLPVASGDQQALVAQAFEDVESLFALGFDDGARPAARDGRRIDTNFKFEIRSSDSASAEDKRKSSTFAFERVGVSTHGHGPLARRGVRLPLRLVSDPPSRTKRRQDTNFRVERGGAPAVPHVASLGEALGTAARMATDTTTYTGVYDGTKGYLVQMQYRQPQGVGVWTARVQHARLVAGPNGSQLDAVETVTLTFLDYPALEAFVGALQASTIPYLTGASGDAEASFSSYDTWRVAQLYSPAEGQAVVSYANAQLRESVTVREPVVTRNANGTGTVRDGGPDGSVRTRYYGADFAVSSTGAVTGTLLRTLTSIGDAADGSVVSRSDYPDGSFRQTRQRGGDGVVVRENTQG